MGIERTREFDIKDEKLLVNSTTKEEFTKEQIKNVWDTFMATKQNLTNGMMNAMKQKEELGRQMAEWKPSSDLKKVCAAMHLTVENLANALNEIQEYVQKKANFSKLENDMQNAAKQLEETTANIEELGPWHSKLIGEEDRSVG